MSAPSRISWAALSVFWVLVAGIAGAHCQDVHTRLHESIVYIEMKGVTDDGRKLSSVGTGFYVSDEGHILTSYHLYNKVREAVPATLEIGVSATYRQLADRKAFVVDARPSLDLMLLKARTELGASKPVKIGFAAKGLSKVFSQGFASQDNPPDAKILRAPHDVQSEEGPAGFTWIVSGQAEAGKSGSPIYTEDGTVVGVLKAEFGGKTVFVPIQNAASLLAGLVKPLSETDLAAWLNTPPGIAALDAWFAASLKRGGAKAIDQALETHYGAQDNQLRVDQIIERRLDNYMKQVVAYSYSTSFLLSTDALAYSFPFFKTNNDKGEIHCTARYPNTLVKNRIFMQYNDRQDKLAFVPVDESTLTELHQQIAEENRYLFDDPPPGVKTSLKVKDQQRVRFAVDDSKKFTGSIRVECTILIIGPAKAYGKIANQ